MRERWTRFFLVAFFFLPLFANSKAVCGCKLFAATGDVTADTITILGKDRDMYWRREQRIWYSPREHHGAADTIHFRNISIPQCSLTYKFLATNSIVEDQTAGYGVNEYGLSIISHDMDSWDDDNLGAEYFHDQDYVALVLARCKKVSEAIDLFDNLILPHGINAEAYLIADTSSLWLLETTGFNYVAKPIVDDVVSSQNKRFNIGTEWGHPGNRHNENLLANAQAHGCNIDTLDFAECFGNMPPGVCDPDLLALKDRGDISVEDMRALVSDKAHGGTVSACIIPIRSDKHAGYFSCMWDSRANPQFGNIFLPYWIAITDTALPRQYTTWPPDDPDCAWSIFSEIAEDSTLREMARPIWQALQAELYTEFDTVEATMQTYMDSNNFAGLQEHIDNYVYGELQSAYSLAKDIISSIGVPEKVHELTITLTEQDLTLMWTAVTVDTRGNPLAVDVYRVYRDTCAFFEPGASPVDSTEALFYVDTSGVVGDDQTPFYYLVTALAGGKESGYSRRVGEFDQRLRRTK